MGTIRIPEIKRIKIFSLFAEQLRLLTVPLFLVAQQQLCVCEKLPLTRFWDILHGRSEPCFTLPAARRTKLTWAVALSASCIDMRLCLLTRRGSEEHGSEKATRSGCAGWRQLQRAGTRRALCLCCFAKVQLSAHVCDGPAVSSLPASAPTTPSLTRALTSVAYPSERATISESGRRNQGGRE